ncbi:MAG: hypothetical protein FWC60_08805, partial [Firmicutes bacterium]|nr:hypothetical protein [Bacillota bacterium]
GHGVGQVSRGILYPLHGGDFLTAAVAAHSLKLGDIEPVTPLEGPLDVLAQVLISMTAVETWSVDELYAFLKTSYPYRNLPRKSYDLLLEMLAGRYADTRLRELSPRIVLDKLEGTVKARDGAARLVYQGGGTIPDRGYYDLRLMDSKAKIGELDEEFVWERSLGETFMLGSRIWRIMLVTHNDVEVVPGDRTVNIIPFWRSEEQNRDFYYAEKIGLFLAAAQEHHLAPEWFAGQPAFIDWSADALRQLIEFLKRQQEETGQPLPHRHHILIEHFTDPLNTADSKQVIVHTLWGGRVNRPWAMALAAAWERKFGYPLETYVSNNCVLFMLPHSFASRDLFSLVAPQNLESLLRGKLESSGFFGAKFRENAGRALLLPKASFKKRMPLWLNRLRAKKLMAAVTPYADFPIMLETWRTCLKDEFDLETVSMLLDEINDGRIRISEAVTHRPSPFAADVVWRRTNKYMYEDDTPFEEQQSGLSKELLQELVYTPHLRPAIPLSLVRELDGKLKRTAPGYAPADGEELLLWLKERLFIPAAEAEELWAAMERDWRQEGQDGDKPDRKQLELSLAGQAAWLHLPGAEQPGLCALEILPRIAAVWEMDFSQLDLRPLATTLEAGKQLAAGLAKAAAIGEREGAGDSLRPGAQNRQYYAALGEREGAGDSGALESDTALFVHQWLTYYGPVPRDFVQRRLGLLAETCGLALATLLEEEDIVADVLTQGSAETEICDRENLERLLLMVRRASRPVFKALPAAQLPLFLAAYQGLVDKGLNLEDLQVRLEQLFGYIGPAGLWEEAVLPARMEPYYSSWLDSLLQTSDLIWFGWGRKRTGFCLAEDWELFQPEGESPGEAGKPNGASKVSAAVKASKAEKASKTTQVSVASKVNKIGKASEADETGAAGMAGKASGASEAGAATMADEASEIGKSVWSDTTRLDAKTAGEASEASGAGAASIAGKASGTVGVAGARALFPDPWGKYDFFALSRHTGLPSDILTDRLWAHVWLGQVTNDSFAVLRKGIQTKFTPFQTEERRGFNRRTGYNRWSASRPLQGNWRLLPEREERDPVDREELNKDRIRQLFARYGVLFRELLQHELPDMQWRRIFRSLRLMEFAGEIYAGHFFEQITGLQFISREAYRFLSRGLNEDGIYWLNAVDPASPCGLKLPGLDSDLPARLPTNYIVLHGARLKVVAKRNGKELLIKAEPDDPALPEYFAFCKTLLTRDFNPLKKIVVETVNNRPVWEGPYKKALLEIGFTVEYKSLALRRQY